MALPKKQDVKRLCRTAVIRQSDFADLVMACKTGRMHWNHRAYHRNFTPPHLHPSKDDLAALAGNGVGRFLPPAQKAANKIFAIFEERRMLSGHMFYSDDLSDWSFFYFDQRDLAEHGNHWRGGSHIHFINHLWPGRAAEAIWKEFCHGNPDMRGAMHVRFDRRYPRDLANEDSGEGVGTEAAL
jgi:hypothetical protein